MLFADLLIATADFQLASQLRVVLQNAGYTVWVVNSGQALREFMAVTPPQLLILDVPLPGEDAIALVRELKAALRVFVPVIVLVGREETVDFATAINAGADEVLHHPLFNAELLVRVRSMLRLKEMTDALNALNASLEAKVIERTRALEQTHAALRHSEKLASLGQLAASVAHEINNPLSVILSYIYLLKHSEGQSAELAEDLEVIQQQIQLIARLVQKLQHFAKPPRPEQQLVAVDQVWVDVLALVRKDLEHHKIMIKKDWSPELPPVLASADQLGEVFLNLVLNARDAMPEGGHLTIALEVEGEWVVTRVSDTGRGIPPEVQERIFEPFFTTKGERGTGLGLAISQRIVQEHGGTIEVSSVPAVGTTFTVRLPVAVPEGAREG